MPNELPFLFLYIVIGSNLPNAFNGELEAPSQWLSLALAGLTSAGLIVVARPLPAGGTRCRAGIRRRSGPRAMAERARSHAQRWPTRHLPWARILFLPWLRATRRRARGRHRLRRRRPEQPARRLPAPLHRPAPDADLSPRRRLHAASKNREARPLLYRLAASGWTCISANYRLSPTPAKAPPPPHRRQAGHRWARTRRARRRPRRLFVAGSSARHVAAMAALTANDPTFQPGFEDADTSITGGIGLYGYYGPLASTRPPPSTPLAYVGPAPPFFLVHGDHDTYTPVEGARPRRPPAGRLRHPRRVRRATRRPALLRPVPLDPLRGRHRRHRMPSPPGSAASTARITTK